MSSTTGATATVTDWLDENREALIDLARELVQIPSVNPRFEVGEGLNREADVQAVVAAQMEAAGMTTETYELFPGRPQVYGFFAGSDDRSLIFNGHIDVVPVGDESSWTVPPFDGVIRDDRLYGRGTFDMKASMAAALTAVRALHQCGIELEGRLEVHSVIDEEAGGHGSMDMVRRRQASAMLCVDSSEQKLLTIQGGLEWVRVSFTGQNAHTGLRYLDLYPHHPLERSDPPGVNAAELVASFIIALRDLERDWARWKPQHPLMPPGNNTLSVGAVQVGSAPGADGLPTIWNNPAITPDVGFVDIDLKYLPTESSSDIRREFEAFVHDWAQQNTWLREHPPILTWELHGLRFPPCDTAPDHPLALAIARHHEQLTGRQVEVAGCFGVMDMGFYAAAGVPSLSYGPDGAAAHAPDEWVSIQSLLELAKVYARTAIDYCGVV